jgi:hypothetical protein
MNSRTGLSHFASRVSEFICLSVADYPRIRSVNGHQNRRQDNCAAEEEQFGALALELFGLQFKQNAAYRRFCQGRGANPKTITSWREIPAMPAAGFKDLDLTCLPAEDRTTVFHSSGTTEMRSSRHFHNAESLAIYETSLWTWFAAQVLSDFKFQISNFKNFFAGLNGLGDPASSQPSLVILTPPPTQVPHSSLAYMFETIRRKVGLNDTAFLGKVTEQGTWTLDMEAISIQLKRAIAAKRPLVMLGTAFSFVHLLDELIKRDLTIELPPDSRALETGGYKGRSRSLPKAELHSLITERLGIPSNKVISEYGMSELSSQAYDGEGEPRTFRFPPWCRVQLISPETGSEVADGQVGLVRVFDLANIYSVMSIQTEDLGIRRGGGFELIGRAAMAEPRGCSLMDVSS